jgi:hypothetical protein
MVCNKKRFSRILSAIGAIEKQDNIFEKMLILKYTFKTGVFSRFFLLFSLPLKMGVFYLKIVECPELTTIYSASQYYKNTKVMFF